MPSSLFPRLGSGQGVPAYRGGGLAETVNQLLSYKPAYSGTSNMWRTMNMLQRMAYQQAKLNAPPKLTASERKEQEAADKLHRAITEMINDPVFQERYRKMHAGSTTYRDRELQAIEKEFVDKQAIKYGVSSTDIYDRVLKPDQIEFAKHKEAVQQANDWGYTASLLKQGWDELWKPIWAMRPGGDADATARELEESQRKIEESNLYAADLKKREQEGDAGFMPDTLVNTIARHVPSIASYIGLGLLGGAGAAAAGARLATAVPRVARFLGSGWGQAGGGALLTAPMGGAQSNVDFSRRILADPTLTEEQKQAALADDSARALATAVGAAAGGFTGSVRPLASVARAAWTRAGRGEAGRRVRQMVADETAKGTARSEAVNAAMTDAAERWALAASQRGVARRMGLEALNQGAGMAGLSAGQMFGSNVAHGMATGQDVPYMQGVGDAALTGGIMGAILGGPFGAARRVPRPQNRTDSGEVRDTLPTYAQKFNEAVENGDANTQKNLIADLRDKYNPKTEPDAFANFLTLSNLQSPESINVAMRIYGNPRLAERFVPREETARTLGELHEVLPAKDKSAQEILADLKDMNLLDGAADNKKLVDLQKQIVSLRGAKDEYVLRGKLNKLLTDAGFYSDSTLSSDVHDEVLPFIEWVNEVNAGTKNAALVDELARHQRFVELHRQMPENVNEYVKNINAAKSEQQWANAAATFPDNMLPAIRQVLNDAPIKLSKEKRAAFIKTIDDVIVERGGTPNAENGQLLGNGEQATQGESRIDNSSPRTDSTVAANSPDAGAAVVIGDNGTPTFFDGATEIGGTSGAETQVFGENEANAATPPEQGGGNSDNTTGFVGSDNSGSGETPASNRSSDDKGVGELGDGQLPEESGGNQPTFADPVKAGENGKPKLYFNPTDSAETATVAMTIDNEKRKFVFGRELSDEELAQAIVGTLPVVRKDGNLVFDETKAAQLFKSNDSVALLRAWGDNPWSKVGVANLMRNAREYLKLAEDAPLTNKNQLRDYAISLIESKIDNNVDYTENVVDGC